MYYILFQGDNISPLAHGSDIVKFPLISINIETYHDTFYDRFHSAPPQNIKLVSKIYNALFKQRKVENLHDDRNECHC